MRIHSTLVSALLAGAAIAGAAHAGTAPQYISGNGFEVTYEGENAGVQNTTASFSVGGVEDFETYSSLQNGSDVTTPIGAGSNSYNGSAATYHDFTTDFGTNGKIVGTYTNVDVIPADQYGGAGGTGSYAVSFGGSRGQPYSLTLNTPVNYFGYWLSALDKGNIVSFYGANDKLMFTFNATDVLAAVNTAADPWQYYGNPNAAYKGQDGGEPFIFVNFFDTKGDFSKIVFSEVNNGSAGYESDNHTVGLYTSMGQGTKVQQTLSAGVPEPAAWAMMIVGVGFVGAVSRRRRALADGWIAA